jgi:hypothetical protein
MSHNESHMIHWRRRLHEWRSVVWKERSSLSVPRLLRAVLSGPVPRAVWRRRMRYGCGKCPIHARKLIRVNGVLTWTGLHACRAEFSDAPLGCGCLTTAVALTANPYGDGCWAHSLDGETGWPAHVWPSRWAKWRAVAATIFR